MRILLLIALVACSEQPPSLERVERWAYVIQQQTEGGKIAKLAASNADLVVIDEPRSFTEQATYDAAGDVATLHAAGKLVLAYVDIGEAEAYRTYWQASWKVGDPAWIVAADPDGWAGNYPVAYWDPAWRAIVMQAVDRLVADGYDGIYLDWIEAAFFDPVVARAAKDGVDPKTAMVDLVRAIKERGIRVVAQNATDLRDAPGYLALLDGEAQEQVSFDGLADVYGTDPRQGDCALPAHDGDPPPSTNAAYCDGLGTLDQSTDGYVRALADYVAAGVPVFTVDYALRPEHAQAAYALAANNHFRGLVTMRSLEDVSATPPP